MTLNFLLQAESSLYARLECLGMLYIQLPARHKNRKDQVK